MHKVTYTERRSGVERRQRSRRGLLRFLKDCLKPSTYRRHTVRRAFYIRGKTYTQYEPDRI